MERLESSLEDTDLVKFSLKLLQSIIISKDVKDNFDCLDSDHLEADIKVRYLLQQVCERVREDDKVYDRLVRVLRRLGGGVKDVCEAMRKELDRVEGGKASGGAEGGVCLTEKDVPYLVKVLVSGSCKWNVIGIALGVPEYVRDECSYHRDNPSKLSRILTAWISGSYDGARPATVDVLREALSSELVMLPKLVQYLNKFNTRVETSTETRLPSLESLPQIEHQSYDTKVTECKSTLLEVQVSSSGCESYQWSKDGQPLLDGADFSGVSSNILYIDRASQGTEGKYSCSVSNGSETVCSDEINLMVIKLPIEELDLVKLLDCLLNSEVISRCIYNKFASLDQVHLEPDIKVRYLLQQVCERVREDDKVYDRLVRVLRRLDGTLRDICAIMRKGVDRDKEGRAIYAGTMYGVCHCSLSINPVPTTNRACSNIDPEIHTEVAEGKSTLLELQLSSNVCESYRWRKDGQPLLDGADFSGVSSNILYIDRASQGTEGKYSCCVSNGSETVCSDEINLMIIYPPEKEHLIKLYSLMESEVPKDSWPPVGNSTFINLVLIKQSPISRCDYYTICGDMDDILESKEVVKYEEVFREYKEGRLLLVEGRPGSGKTTLVHKVASDWAKGNDILQGAKLVFLVPLRLLNKTSKDESILGILRMFYADDAVIAQVKKDLERSGGRGVCFIIDGLDEYRHADCSIIQELLEKKYICSSMIIVASRPVATSEIKKYASKRIEVLGFTKQQIYDYISKYYFEDDSMASRLESYLKVRANILHMCYLPVHAAMICYLFSQLEGNIPHTETEIYKQFTITTLLRQRAREKEPIQCIKSFKDLCEKDKAQFDKICKLAFQMLTESQQFISQSETKIPLCGDSENDTGVLGLITVEHSYKLYGVDNMYTFLHLTFQEYLAAVYVAQLGKEGQMKVVYEYRSKSELKNMWKFVWGIVKPDYKDFELTLSYSLLHAIQCAFESQRHDICNSIVRHSILSFCKTYLTPSDFTALGYVICTASTDGELDFDNCMWETEGIVAFCAEIERHETSCITRFHFDARDHKHEYAETLNHLLRKFHLLKELDLRNLKLSKSVIKTFCNQVSQPYLQVLRINLPFPTCSQPKEILKMLLFNGRPNIYFYWNNSLGEDLATWRRYLCQALDSPAESITKISFFNSNMSSLPTDRHSCCTVFSLISCEIDNTQTKVLVDGLNSSILTNLKLDFNRISDSGAEALAGCIARCSVVQEVSIQCNSIGDFGAIAIADALVHCSSLRRLNLQGNALGDEGAVAIAKSVQLHEIILHIYNINITEDGAKQVLKYKQNANVTSVEYSSWWRTIADEDTDSIKNTLLRCHNIPMIQILPSNIDKISPLITQIDHLKSIRFLNCLFFDNIKGRNIEGQFKIFRNFKALQGLHLMCASDISAGDLHSLSEVLKSNNNLQTVDVYQLRYDPKHIDLGSTIIPELKHCQFLQEVSINNCHIDPYILQGANFFAQLKKLVLSRAKIQPAGMKILSEILVDSKTLLHLDLSFNWIGDDGAVFLAKVLKHCRSLQDLYLLGNEIGTRGLSALCETNTFINLRSLDFSCNRLSPDSARLLSNMFRKNTSLNYLKLLGSINQLPGDLSASFSCDFKDLGYCRNLCSLKLERNKLGDDDASILVEVMKNNKLQILNLGENSIGPEGAAILSVGLTSCKKLLEFDISSNCIEFSGLESLAKGLRCCTCLRKLKLQKNQIKPESSSALLVIMKSCEDLQELNLSGNTIGVDSAAELISGWNHKHLLKLNLTNTVDYPHECPPQWEEPCSSCTFLKHYYSNDYITVTFHEEPGLSIPKLV